MKKQPLKKLLSTSLLMLLAMDINHAALAGEVSALPLTPQGTIDMSKILDTSTRIRVVNLRQQGKQDPEIVKILEQDKKNLESNNNSQHGEEIQKYKEEIDTLKKENAHLNSLAQNTGKSIPKDLAFSAADIGRLQEENRQLSEALKGLQESSQTYKNIQEELKRVQSELELAKKQEPKPTPSQPPVTNAPPPGPKPTAEQPPVTNAPPPPMTNGGPPPPPPMANGAQAPQDMTKVNNTALIKAIDEKLASYKKELDENNVISSTQNKAHLALLIEEFFGLLKTYAAENPKEAPGLKNINKSFLDFLQNDLDDDLKMIGSRSSIEVNNERVPALLKKLTRYIEQTEGFIHTQGGNPFKFVGKSVRFTLQDLLIPKTAPKPSSDQPKIPKKITTAPSTLKDTLDILLGAGIVSTKLSTKLLKDKETDEQKEARTVAEKVSEALAHHTKNPNIASVLKGPASGIEELSLLIGPATKDEIIKLWDKTLKATQMTLTRDRQEIKDYVINAKIDDLISALNKTGQGGIAGEADFKALLRQNNISATAIGIATMESDKATATFRDTTLKHFITLKLISEIITSYRESIGGAEGDEISKLQGYVDAYKTHMATVSQGNSPVKDTKVQGYTASIKELEEKIAELEKKKERYKEPLETANKMILKLDILFKAPPYVVPKAFKSFMDSALGQEIQGKTEPKVNPGTGPLPHASGGVVQKDAPHQPTVTHDEHQQAVAKFKGAFDRRVGGDGKFIAIIDQQNPKGDRSKHVFASLLELKAEKFKALTTNQEKMIGQIAHLETPDVIEALIYHMAQDKNAFEKNPIIMSLSTQLQTQALKLTTIPHALPAEKTLNDAKSQIGTIVSTLKK